MDFYKTPDGRVHAFEPGYAGPLRTEDMLPISEVEAIELSGPGFTAAKELEMAQFRANRREMFSVISGMGFEAVATGDTVTRDALVTFRAGVKDLPEWPAVVDATTITQLRAAMSARYKSLTAALPAAIKADFKKLYP